MHRTRQVKLGWRCGLALIAASAAVMLAGCSKATPEQTALANERFRHLDTAVRSLDAQERECLMLRAEGLRYRDIGEVLGIPTSTVADTVERAIKKLAEKCNV